MQLFKTYSEAFESPKECMWKLNSQYLVTALIALLMDFPLS